MSRSSKPKPKELPRALEAEASVLGGVILANDALAVVPDLCPEDFYDGRHRVIFEAMRNLEARGAPIDVVTLENEIEKAGKLEAIGGVAFLGELTLRVPTVDNVEEYARIVTTKRISRDVIVMLSDMMDEAYSEDAEGEELCHDVTTAVMMIRTRSEQPIITMAELIAREATALTKDVERSLSGERVYPGVPTGITKLDHQVGGIPIGVPTLVIARPANGKTTIAMMFAAASGRLAGMESLLASYEDAGGSFGQRALAQESGIATENIRARRVSADQLISVMAAQVAGRARQENFLSASGMTVEALVRRVRRENVARRLAGRPKLKQLLVDYVQKMPMPEWSRSRDEGIAHISTALANLAVSEEMAVVEMCQLNREVEKREDHVPRLSDIRDSGALEQDGKLILALYYPWQYRPDPKHHRPEELHMVVLKNAQGESALDIKLWWDVKSHAVYDSEIDYQAARSARASVLRDWECRRGPR